MSSRPSAPHDGPCVCVSCDREMPSAAASLPDQALVDEIDVLTEHVNRLQEHVQYLGRIDELRRAMDAMRERRRVVREGMAAIAPPSDDRRRERVRRAVREMTPPLHEGEIRRSVELSRETPEIARTNGETTLVTLTGAVEELLASLSDREGDALDRHARVTEAIAALGRLGVRLPQIMVDRIERGRGASS